MKLTSRTMTASWRRLREHVLLGENTSLLVLNHKLVTNEVILWDDDDDGDHVPELGVMSVHEQCSTSSGRY